MISDIYSMLIEDQSVNLPKNFMLFTMFGIDIYKTKYLKLKKIMFFKQKLVQPKFNTFLILRTIVL